MKINNVLILSKYARMPGRREHEYVLEDGLEERGIDFEIMAGHVASSHDFEGRDLIISFGGDGTVLDASKNLNNGTPLLTVRSSDDSVGAICVIGASGFGEALDRIMEDDFIISGWDRAEGEVDGEKHLALNEIYVGPRFSSGPGRYDVLFRGMREYDHRSSGIVAATGTGSTGWYANVEYSEGQFEKYSGLLKFAARDCIEDENHTITHGTIQRGEELEIISRYKFDGAIDFDGYYRKSLDFPSGTRVKIRLSDNPLKVITFPDNE